MSDVVNGSSDSDVIDLSDSTDDTKVVVGSGDDIVASGSGDDVINAGDGSDLIDSGSGDDVIKAGDGDDIVIAGAGDDHIKAGDGDDVITGGDGDDTIFGGDGYDTSVYEGNIQSYLIQDVDGDGDLDLVIADGKGNSITFDTGELAGEDTLKQIEALQFDNGTYVLADSNQGVFFEKIEDLILSEDFVTSEFSIDLISATNAFDLEGDDISVVAGSVSSSLGLEFSLIDGAIVFQESALEQFQSLDSGESLADTIFFTLTDSGSGNTYSSSFNITIHGRDEFSGGVGVDGYIVGATVFSDDNGDGALTAGEASDVTDGQGGFTLINAGTGHLVLSGGIDISTNLAFEGTLKAPSGTTAITALSTIVAGLMDTGSSEAAALDLVKSSFGIDINADLLNLDPVAETLAGNADGESVMAMASQLLNTVTQIANLLEGAGASDLSHNINVVFAEIVKDLNASDYDGSYDLTSTDSAQIESLINDSAQTLGITITSELVEGAATVITASNDVTQALLDGTSAGEEFLISIAQVTQVAQSEVANALEGAADDGTTEAISTVIDLYTGTNLTDEIDSAQVGDVDGLVVTPESVILTFEGLISDTYAGVIDAPYEGFVFNNLYNPSYGNDAIRFWETDENSSITFFNNMTDAASGDVTMSYAAEGIGLSITKENSSLFDFKSGEFSVNGNYETTLILRGYDENGALISSHEQFIDGTQSHLVEVTGFDQVSRVDLHTRAQEGVETWADGNRQTILFDDLEMIPDDSIPNSAPIVATDSKVVGEDKASVIFTFGELLGNDIDLDGDSISIVDFDYGGLPQGVTFAADYNNEIVTIDFGNTYQGLGASETAQFSFSYTVSDDEGATADGNVNITINGDNDSPTVSAAIVDQHTEQDQPYNIDLLQFVEDIDTNLDLLTVSNLQLISGDGSGVVFDASTNSLQVNPDQYDALSSGQSEVINFSYSIEDGQGGSVLQTATITITGATDGTEFNDLLRVGSDTNDHLVGHGGNDTLQGIRGIDILEGGEGNDLFYVYDLTPEDVIDGGTGIDSAIITSLYSPISGLTLYADSEGNLAGTAEDGRTLNLISIEKISQFYGGSGNDSVDASGLIWQEQISLDGGRGVDQLIGTDGDDYFSLDDLSGADLLDGGLGLDTVILGDTSTSLDIILNGDANGLLEGSIGGIALNLNNIESLESFYGGAGNDQVDISGLTPLGYSDLSGGDGNDRLTGADGSDYLNGDEGTDTLYGGAGNDYLYGGSGNDFLYGNTGNDYLSGGSGNDLLRIDDFNVSDTVDGGDGSDRVYLSGVSSEAFVLSAGVDGTLKGTLGGIALNLIGLERLYGFDGGSGNDQVDISGLSGAGSLHGGFGDDSLIGGADNDFLYGDEGNDFLTGNAGIDALHGGSGNDWLSSGIGNDYLWGNAGADQFVFILGETGTDRLYDFSEAEGDVIDFTGLLSNSSGLWNSGESLSSIINITFDGTISSLSVDADGDGSIDQTLEFWQQDLTQSGALDTVGILNDLINTGSLITGLDNPPQISSLSDDVFLAGRFNNSATGVLLSDGATLAGTGQVINLSKTRSMEAADIDGDGDLDVVTANDTSNSLIFLNDGSGQFSLGQNLNDTNNGWDVALGDFDSDGDLDIYSAYWSGYDKLWLNNGSGNFTNSIFVTASSGASRAVEAGDVNGDGHLDVVVANSSNGGGLAAEVLLNDGTGSFTQFTTFGTDRSYDLDMADLDGDGDLDVVIGTYLGDNTVWFNNGDGTYNQSAQVLNSTSGAIKVLSYVELGDLNSDGNIDAVVANYGSSDEIWLNNGDGSFTLQQTVGTSADGTNSHGALVDVDRDGDLDYYANNDSGGDKVWFNEGDGTFLISETMTDNQGSASAVIAGDFDGSNNQSSGGDIILGFDDIDHPSSNTAPAYVVNQFDDSASDGIDQDGYEGFLVTNFGVSELDEFNLSGNLSNYGVYNMQVASGTSNALSLGYSGNTYAIESADGSEFDLAGMLMASYTSAGQVTLTGYKDGVQVSSEVVNVSPQVVDATFSSMTDVDRVEFNSSVSNVFFDEISLTSVDWLV